MAGMSPIFNASNLGDVTGMQSNAPQDVPDVYELQQLPDGSTVYGMEPDSPLDMEPPPEREFYANLADELDDGILGRIAYELLDKIEDDLEARKGWELALDKGIKYLGFMVEESRDYPFMNACSAFDTTLSTALIRFWATTRSELLPAEGPVRCQIAGPKTMESESRAERLKAWLNYYLTRVDKGYYPDFIRMLMYTGLAGTTYRKIYQCPLTGRPLSRFIEPQDFIIDADATSIYDAGRLTHRMTKTQKDIKLLQRSGHYRDTKLSDSDDNVDELTLDKTIRNQEGLETHALDTKKNLTIYECHAEINLKDYDNSGNSDDEDMPLPYIVTISATDKTVLAIRRNWKENDPLYRRIECFVRYDLLPGFGVNGIGYAQLLGSNAIALTSILRQLIDAGTLKNFPGGLRVKGLRIEENDINIGPSEFREIDTGGMPIRDAIMNMPYAEPSSALIQLREKLAEDTLQLGATADIKLTEMSNETPVGTTMAMLEVQTKVPSAILRSMHMSLTQELEIIYDLFADGLEDDPGEFFAEGMNFFIKREDFTADIRVVPVSDPNLTTSTQRLLRAEAILRLAQSNPEIHDLRNAYRRMYMAMNVEDIDSLLVPEEQIAPLDPITENKHSLEGKGLKAAQWQDHDAHLILHEAFSQQNPDVQSIRDHIFEHRAMKYVVDMQAKLGIQLPPMEQMQSPDIQNAIAVQMATKLLEQQQEEAAQNPQLSPEQIAMMDIEQRREAAKLKNEEASARVALESFKTERKSEVEMAKIEAELEMSEDKNITDLEIAELKEANKPAPRGSE